MAVTELKGHGIVGALAVLERITTRENVDKILALSPRTGPMLRSKQIVASGWYDISLYAEFTNAMRTVLGPDISRRMGVETTIADVNSLFRFVLHLFSPESLAKFAPRIFSAYVKGPRAIVEKSDAHSMQCNFHNFAGANQGIYEEFTAASAMFVELGGGKDVKAVIIDGGKDGDAWVRFLMTWA